MSALGRRRARPAAVYVAVSSRLLHPRALLGSFVVLYAVVGWQTSRYSPAWLAFPYLWTGLAGVASVSSLVALLRPSRLAMSTAGASVVVAAFARGLAIFRELLVDPPSAGDAVASFTIACASWFALALLAWQAFTTALVPWCAVAHRSSSRSLRRGGA